MNSLVEIFSQNFCVLLATTHNQRNFAYAIRYQVYAEEFGWEPLNNSRLETDNYDDYAYHCLLEHKRSGDIVGCVRLIPSTISKFDSPLPCQIHQIPMLSGNLLSDFTTTAAGEISRLAVPNYFRRRVSKRGKPLILDRHPSFISIYSKEERRAFSKIAICLYLSSLAMGELCNLEYILAIMEPSLHRHLQRSGLYFHKISHFFEMRGKRALFKLPRQEFTINMNEQILKLYHLIRFQLDLQYEKILQPHYNSTRPHDYL